MTTPTLGNGDFIITANSTDFERARADVFGVMRQIDRRADQTADLIDQRFTDAANDISRQFAVAGANMERSITRATENISDEVQQMGRDIERSVTLAAAGLAEQFDRELAAIRAESERTAHAVGQDADSMGDAIAREIARGVAVANAALALLGDGSDRALGTITRLAGGMSKLLVTLSAASVGFAAMANAVAAVAASMEQLAGVAFLAPAAILSLVAVTNTLKVALNGVSETISAGLSGDMKAYEEALKKLSPAAREAVQGLAPVIERMRELRTVIQDRFFQQFGKDLEEFGKVAIGVAERSLPQLADSLGEVTEHFLEAAQSTRFLSGIEAVLKRTASGVAKLATPVGHLTAAIGELFLVGAGYVDRFYDSLGRVIDRFATWLLNASSAGKINVWIDEALAGFQQLGRILGNVGGIFATLNGQATTAGTGILSILERITEGLNKAFASDVGQSFLISAFDLLAEIMKSLGIILPPVLDLLARVVTIVNNQLSRAVAAINPYLQALAGWLGDIGKTVTQAAPQVTSFAEGAIGYLADRLRVLLDALAPIGDAVAGTGDALARTFSELDTGTLDSIISALGNLAVNLADVGSDALVALSRVFAELVRLSPRVIGLFDRVAVIVGGALVEAFDAVTPLLDPVLTFLEKLVPILDLASTAFVVVVKGVSDLAVALAPLANSIADVGGSMADDLNPAVRDLGDSFSRNAAPAIERLSQALGDKLAAGFERMRPALAGLIDGFRQMGEPAGKLIESFGRLVLAFGPLTSVLGEFGAILYEKAIPAVTALAQALFAVITTFGNILTPIIRGLSEVLGEALTEAARNLAPILSDMGEKFGTIANAVEKLQPVLVGLEYFLSILLPIALEVLRVAITATFDTIVLIIRNAWEIISGVLGTLILFLQGDFAGAWNRAKEMVSGIWDAISDYIVGVVDRIVTFFENTGIADIARAVGRAFQAAYDEVVDWLSSAYDAVVQWIANVLLWFSRLPGLIKTSFVNASTIMFEAGKDIVQGLINGIIDRAKDIGGIVTDWIVNPIKNVIGGIGGFKFGSPSKVTTQYGEWISEGLAIGIKEAEASVVAAAESLTRSAALPGMNPSAPGMGVNAGPPPFTPNARPTTTMGSGVVFGPGSVQVTFQGVVPSESEAFATGQAVGAGIADVIARRDARVSVGVL